MKYLLLTISLDQVGFQFVKFLFKSSQVSFTFVKSKIQRKKKKYHNYVS
jgi:hypothetical protein